MLIHPASHLYVTFMLKQVGQIFYSYTKDHEKHRCRRPAPPPSEPTVPLCKRQERRLQEHAASYEKESWRRCELQPALDQAR